VSVAELVSGEPLRILGELLTPTADLVDPALLVTELCRHMARLRPNPAARHASPATFMHSNMDRCTHVFLRQDALRRALEPPYSGPYQILSRRDKTLRLLIRGRPVTMSTDRVKPTYSLNGTIGGTDSTPDSGSSTTHHPRQPSQPQTSRRPPHHNKPPHKPHDPDATCISLLALTSEQPSPRGGGVGTFHSITSK
jgi:hypothetical protein